MAKNTSRRYKDIPVEIAGSTKFGRYDKISVEQTWNMIVSDGWLVNFAGYRNVNTVNPTGQGRGIYGSSKLTKLFAVIDNNVYFYDPSLSRSIIGSLTTFEGDVFIAENNASQVAFSDGVNIYIYNNLTSTFTTLTGASLGFKPGYLTFQNGRFISPDTLTNQWRLSEENNGLVWPNDAQHVGALQTKPDTSVATIRFPGRGNLLLVFGRTVSEQWYDVGAQLFPYQRSQSSNIDYGCLNPATIAELESMVCWVAANEKSGPVITYTNGGEIRHISNDGIDFKLAQLRYPTDCYGFMFKQDGHLFYVATWPSDNQTYAYDFNTSQFYTLSDENLNAFIAKRVAFFNNQYYFVSLRDGNLYQLSSRITDFDYGVDSLGNEVIHQIPRIRIPAPIALPDQSRFVVGYSGFTIEQGQMEYDYRSPDNNPRIDLSVSKNGGVSWSNVFSKKMYPLGKRQNRLMWWQLGDSNYFNQQYRFYGFGRFIATNGITGIAQ